MKYLKQLAIILAISFIAQILEAVIPLPVAASIYGLILMLAGLMTHIIKLSDVEDVADFLVEILPLLFIPATVSIIADLETLWVMLVPLLVISVVSTLLIAGVTGRSAQFLLRLKKNKISDSAPIESDAGSSEKSDKEEGGE